MWVYTGVRGVRAPFLDSNAPALASQYVLPWPRVGAGPFPTEDHGEDGERLRDAGGEYGATTGRPRRCGWFDAVLLREAVVVNGITDLAINKLDILSGFEELKLATAYKIGGKVTEEFPMTLDEMSRAEPVYEMMPGWQEDLAAWVARSGRCSGPLCRSPT